jgi:mono/diheme cytochrome c family protein
MCIQQYICLMAILVLGSTSVAQAQSVARGAEYARTHCARCHSIEKTGSSPLSAAPPFRTLHRRYPVESLEEALGEGIVTGHPDMPEFKLDPGQVGDFIAFLKSLQ